MLDFILIFGFITATVGLVLIFNRLTRIFARLFLSPGSLSVDDEVEVTGVECSIEVSCSSNEGSMGPLRRTEREVEDFVQCSGFSPGTVEKNTPFTASILLHLSEQTEAAMQLAKFGSPDAELQFPAMDLSEPVARNSRITISLIAKGTISVLPESTTVVWRGAPGMARFILTPEADARKVWIHASIATEGVPIGYCSWEVAIGYQTADDLALAKAQRYKQAFISYSSDDIREAALVAKTFDLAGIRRFFDKDSLRVGEAFPEALIRELDACDLFILVWSQSAEDSLWVQREMDRAKSRWDNSNPAVPALHINSLIYPVRGLPKSWNQIHHTHVLDHAVYAVLQQKNEAQPTSPSL